MTRDLRLAHKLWRLTRTDSTWLAFTDLLYCEAAQQLNRQLANGNFNKRVNRGKFDKQKHNKLLFIEALTILQELDDYDT